jgi:hypothetical protein
MNLFVTQRFSRHLKGASRAIDSAGINAAIGAPDRCVSGIVVALRGLLATVTDAAQVASQNVSSTNL